MFIGDICIKLCQKKREKFSVFIEVNSKNQAKDFSQFHFGLFYSLNHILQ